MFEWLYMWDVDVVMSDGKETMTVVTDKPQVVMADKAVIKSLSETNRLYDFKYNQGIKMVRVLKGYISDNS